MEDLEKTDLAEARKDPHAFVEFIARLAYQDAKLRTELTRARSDAGKYRVQRNEARGEAEALRAELAALKAGRR